MTTNIYSSNPKNVAIIIPDVTKSQIQAANTIWPVSKGMTALIVITATRAQISASLPHINKSNIQQLESVKWNAKQIAKSPLIRTFVASLVIAQTYHFEFEKIKDLSSEEMEEHAKNLVQELVDTPPSPGNKVLPPRAIKDHNLNSHRLGLMAQKIGNWQAKPLFDPTSIIRNTPITTLTPEILLKHIILLHEQLEIELDEVFLNENNSEDQDVEDGLTVIMKEAIYYKSESSDDQIYFSDPIRLNSVNNKFPLENITPYINRPVPIDDLPTEKLPESLMANKLIKYASMVNETQSKEIIDNKRKFSNKQVPVQRISKPKPKAKPKAKAQPTLQTEINPNEDS